MSRIDDHPGHHGTLEAEHLKPHSVEADAVETGGVEGPDHCEHCAWALSEAYATLSWHRTSQGMVGYTRCLCGLFRVRLRPYPYTVEVERIIAEAGDADELASRVDGDLESRQQTARSPRLRGTGGPQAA